MKSSIHGQVTQVPLDAALTATEDGVPRYSTILSREEAAKTPARPNVFRFGPMFPALWNDRLPDTPGMAARLFDLAQSMQGGDRNASRNTPIPAVYTYLGQFIDHDITKTETLPALTSNMEAAFHVAMAGRDIRPLDDESMALLVNKRVPTLNLDSVLSSAAPRDDRGALVVGTVTADGAPPRPTLPFQEPAELAALHDLPREPKSVNEDLDRRAKIGDPRNDENLVVAQLHVAFLRTHRRLVHELGLTAAEADLELQRLHQSIVVHDYLPTVCVPEVVSAVLEQTQGVFYRPTAADPFMPLEFAVAAFRFGHSQVRNAYNYNSSFSGADGTPIATLDLLFTFTAFSGQNAGFQTLPQNWIIDWSRWVAAQDGSTLNPTRRVDTLLAAGLMTLPQHQGVIGGNDVNILAVRNLIRGYLLRLPTGQAVANAARDRLGGSVIVPLTPQDLRDVATAADADGAAGQLAALTAGGFDQATPLWYYVLAEAATRNDGRLGTTGSFIVADVLVQLARLTEGNFLHAPEWRPRIPTAAPAAEQKVKLTDLLRFAQLLP
ncbi:peroxidase family protein [Variovorax sp. KK3]|uniref:peroxidase family protein n=1 Tax=Variovorax sp. KK3 TaxID=1855728 RepID=UPI00097C173A|nr:peroxidase family protein [Variovorax sp. KK3]